MSVSSLSTDIHELGMFTDGQMNCGFQATNSSTLINMQQCKLIVSIKKQININQHTSIQWVWK